MVNTANEGNDSSELQLQELQELQGSFETLFDQLDSSKSVTVNGNTVSIFSNPSSPNKRRDGIVVEPSDSDESGFTINLEETDLTSASFTIYETIDGGSLGNLPFASINKDGTLGHTNEALVAELNTRLQQLIVELQGSKERVQKDANYFRALVERVLSKK